MSEAYAAPELEGSDQQATEPAEPSGAHVLLSYIDNPNIAHDLPADVLAQMGTKVCEEFEIDVQSRTAEGWDERNEAAMKLALQVKEDKSYPWPKASNVKYPLIATAAIQFNARAYPAVVDGFNIVKGKVLGRPTPEKQDRADRIGRHMSYQLLEEMDGWEEDTDRLLIMLPIVGCVFRKTYFDPMRGYNCSHVVGPDKFVVNYWTRDLESCPRATHVLEFYPHEIAEKMRAGLWLDVDLGQPTGAANDNQAPHTFLEQHRLWDLDGDDYPEPYIITVHKESMRVVRVVARFDEQGLTTDQSGRIIQIKPAKCFTKYPFIPSPDGSFYDIGFGTLLGALGETINTTINQLMDSGHLANVQGGFIGSGVSIKSGNLRFKPGEWKKVETSGATLRDSIVPLPVKEPSSVLFNLLTMLIEASKDVTATQNILTGDMGASNQPVGTTLAVIEQGLKTFSAIVKRIHRALKHELACLYDLNARYLNPQAYFTFQDEEGAIAQQDYAEGDVDVVPVSDPSMATDMQKMGRAQFLMQFLGKGLNDAAIIQRVLEAASIPDIKDLEPQGPPPPDPRLMVETAKLEVQHRQVANKEHETAIHAAEAEAAIAVDVALAQKTMAEAMLALPQFQLQVAQLIDQRVADMMKAQGSTDGEQPNQPIQPPSAIHVPDVSGMAPQPPDAGVPGVPPGSAGPVGEAMGGGPGDGLAPTDQGPPDGGAFPPGMG